MRDSLRCTVTFLGFSSMTHLPTSSQSLLLSPRVYAVFKNDSIQDWEVICISGWMHKFYFSFFCFKSENGFGLSWLTPLFRVCSISILHSPCEIALQDSNHFSWKLLGGPRWDPGRRRRQRRLEPESAMTLPLWGGGGGDWGSTHSSSHCC